MENNSVFNTQIFNQPFMELTMLIIDKKQKEKIQHKQLYYEPINLICKGVLFILVVLLVLDIISNQSSFLCLGEEVFKLMVKGNIFNDN